MPSTAWITPSTLDGDGFANPNNAVALDGSVATGASDWLGVYGDFGNLGIPSDADIVGVEVEAFGSASAANASKFYVEFTLGELSASKTAYIGQNGNYEWFGKYLPTTNAYTTLGSPSTLPTYVSDGGATTPADWNAEGGFVGFWFIHDDENTTPPDVSLDHVRFRVHYKAATKTPWFTPTGLADMGVASNTLNDPGNMATADSALATAQLFSFSSGSKALHFVGSLPAMSIPATATVVGVEVQLKGAAHNVFGTTARLNVAAQINSSLGQRGAIVGADLTTFVATGGPVPLVSTEAQLDANAYPLASATQYVTLGGPTTTGTVSAPTAMTVADWNAASTFEMFFDSSNGEGSSAPCLLSLDHVQMRVHYAVPVDTSVSFPTAASVSTAGTVNWSNPTNIFATDNARATLTFPGSAATTATNFKALLSQGYGFNIPTGSTILGITVAVKAMRMVTGGSSGEVRANTVQLIKNGVQTGSNLATATNFTTTDAFRSYGGASNLWGTTWTAEQINSPTFGVAFRPIGSTTTTNRIIGVDAITIQVRYLEPAEAVPTTIAFTYSNTGSGSQSYVSRFMQARSFTNTGSGSQAYAASFAARSTYANAGSGAQAFTSQYTTKTSYANTGAGVQSYSSYYGISLSLFNNDSAAQSYTSVYALPASYSNIGAGSQAYSSVYVVPFGYSNAGSGSQAYSSAFQAQSAYSNTGSGSQGYGSFYALPLSYSSTDSAVQSYSVVWADVSQPTTATVLPTVAVSESTKNQWITPERALLDDALHATFTSPGRDSTLAVNLAFLNLTGFGLNIPSNATILGVRVRIEGLRYGGNTGHVRDSVIQLMHGGARFGQNKAIVTNWPTTPAVRNYGSSTDVWEAELTPAMLNDSSFGVSIRTTADAGASNRIAAIDYVEIDVTYQVVQLTELAFSYSNTGAGLQAYSSVFAALSNYANTGSGSQTYTSIYKTGFVYSNAGTGAQDYRSVYTIKTPYFVTGTGAQAYSPRFTFKTNYSNVGSGSQAYTSSYSTASGYSNAGAGEQDYNSVFALSLSYLSIDQVTNEYKAEFSLRTPYNITGKGTQRWFVVFEGDAVPDSITVNVEWDEWQTIDGNPTLVVRKQSFDVALRGAAYVSVPNDVVATLVVNNDHEANLIVTTSYQATLTVPEEFVNTP